MSDRALLGPFLLDRASFPKFLTALENAGYETHGPTVREGAIVHGRIRSEKDLPAGWTDEHAPGRYRLRRRDDDALFGYTVGPQSGKNFLHPPRARLFQAKRDGETMTVEAEPRSETKLALLGLRACELAAIGLQDRILIHGEFQDTIYSYNRSRVLLIAVNCTQTARTCFCSSMGTGPRAQPPYDLALTEIVEPDRHGFLVEVGSEPGLALIEGLSLPEAGADDQETAAKRVSEAVESMGRSLDTTGIKELLYESLEHPRWHEVAQRCLACGNCTMVCPTCFCTSVEDTTDLSGKIAERWRTWDSCFTTDFTYIHGGSVRNSTHSKYRQWITHKLASWQDQFGSSGCVGCGRCITWCPVGIDITEEVAAIRANEPLTAGEGTKS